MVIYPAIGGIVVVVVEIEEALGEELPVARGEMICKQ